MSEKLLLQVSTLRESLARLPPTVKRVSRFSIKYIRQTAIEKVQKQKEENFFYPDVNISKPPHGGVKGLRICALIRHFYLCRAGSYKLCTFRRD